MTYLEQAAGHVAVITAAAERTEKQAAERRGVHSHETADALEGEACRLRMWLADRCIALAAIAAGLPPCCCTGHREHEQEPS